MKIPRLRFTVGRIMLAVAVVAIDFVTWRTAWHANRDMGVLYVTLPMASLLIMLAPEALGCGAARGFWIGFEVAGWSMVAVSWYLSQYHGALFFEPANSVYPWPEKIRNPVALTIYLFLLDLVVYTPPQVVTAWLGGRLVAGYRTHRRSMALDPPEPE